MSYVRAYNAYGLGQKYGSGHPQKIFPTLATLAWNNEPIPIRGDGKQLVDLVHVDDVARMLVDALALGSDQVFDAGTGTPFTVMQIAEMVLATTTSKGSVQHLPMRPGETATDATFAKGEGWPLLEWRPRFEFAKFVEALIHTGLAAQHLESDLIFADLKRHATLRVPSKSQYRECGDAEHRVPATKRCAALLRIIRSIFRCGTSEV